MTTALVPWTPTEPLVLSADATPGDIVQNAIQLSQRDQQAVVSAFQSGAYEMASTFLWSKAMVRLKKQLAELGMEFVGEMLGRNDLTEDSNPITQLREDEALGLAEELGMITTTEALRLRTASIWIAHFSDPEVSLTEQMHREEAIGILRGCVVNFLSESPVRAPQPFLELRKKLQTETLKETAGELAQLQQAPYFFLRTTLTVLLNQLKHGSGAPLEHIAGNVKVILPVIWPRLRANDRWQTGETYALVHTSNRKIAATALRGALTVVQGFDYVPETLRSDTYREAARAVVGAHFGWDNYQTEVTPMKVLLQLGSTIPGPALAACFSAVLCVKLGNRWGHSWTAEPLADQFLNMLRPDQWEYYLNRLLEWDRYVLDKLGWDPEPRSRWQELVGRLQLDQIQGNPRVAQLIQSDRTKQTQVEFTARQLRTQMMQNV